MFQINSFPKKPLHWWFKNRHLIDFDPPFQRKSTVWKGRNQSFLVDSILNGYDVPKLYIADFTVHNVPALNAKSKSYAIIDGKQRLTALIAFREDKLALSNTFRLTNAPTLPLGGLTYSGLKQRAPSVALSFDNYVLDVKAIVTDERERINDVFRRLNEASKALNGAENRNARIGEAVDTIRKLGQHSFFTNRIRFDTNRSQELNAAAKVLLLEYEGGVPKDTKKLQLDNFVVSIGENGSGRFRKSVKRTISRLDDLSAVFENNDKLLTTQGNVPLYYLFVSCLSIKERAKVRSFLVWFENERRKNRNARRGNRDLDTYDIQNRSTNDSGSYAERLRIIRKMHIAWRKRTANGSRSG